MNPNNDGIVAYDSQNARTIAHELIDKNLKEIQHEIGITFTKNIK
jgi:hypothetical protein